MKCVYVRFIVLLLLAIAVCRASPVKDNISERDKRQMKASDADVKMLAIQQGNASGGSLNPTTNNVGMGTLSSMQLPVNHVAFNAANMQMTRYPDYAGLMSTGLPRQYGFGLPINSNFPMTGVVNPYPTLDGGFNGINYPTNTALNTGYMYGNLYPSAPIPNNFGTPQQNQFQATQGVDNYATLNNLIHMANVQGLGTSPVAPNFQQTALQPQLTPLAIMPSYFERMPSYAPGF